MAGLNSKSAVYYDVMIFQLFPFWTYLLGQSIELSSSDATTIFLKNFVKDISEIVSRLFNIENDSLQQVLKIIVNFLSPTILLQVSMFTDLLYNPMYRQYRSIQLSFVIFFLHLILYYQQKTGGIIFSPVTNWDKTISVPTGPERDSRSIAKYHFYFRKIRQSNRPNQEGIHYFSHSVSIHILIKCLLTLSSMRFLN